MKTVTNFWHSWYSWLREETQGYYIAVEFGAGFFDKLASVPCQIKIGIEAYLPYIQNARYRDCIMIHGDMMDYRSLISRDKKYYEKSRVAIFIDSLEHIERDKAFSLIAQVKEDFDKIVIMVPNGNIMQESDVTGFDNHAGQTHRSKWFEQDLIELGMDEILVDNDFHFDKEDKRSYFATWKRKQ